MASQEPEFVQVYKAAGQLEAAVIKGKLETAGIPVLLRYESLGIVLGVTTDGLGEVRVTVPMEREAEARWIIEDGTS